MATPTFISTAIAPATVSRAVKIAAIVGTVLTLLNHGDAIASGHWPVWWKIALTYCVPYSVSTYSAAMFAREMGTQPNGLRLEKSS